MRGAMGEMGVTDAEFTARARGLAIPEADIPMPCAKLFDRRLVGLTKVGLL